MMKPSIGMRVTFTRNVARPRSEELDGSGSIITVAVWFGLDLVFVLLINGSWSYV